LSKKALATEAHGRSKRGTKRVVEWGTVFGSASQLFFLRGAVLKLLLFFAAQDLAVCFRG
jgi:hypothetical protein